MPLGVVLSWAGGAWLLLSGILVVFVAGCWAAGRLEAESGNPDPAQVVIDEVAGQWLVLLASPLDWRYVTAAFILFRLFDIVKPWPIRWFDRNVAGGFGIMLDDIVAGIFGAALLLAFRRWLA